MVKAYLRYEPSAAFGVIASGDSNITYDSSGKHVLAPALEKINIWHVRQSLCIKTLEPTPPFPGPSLAVTSIASSPDSSLVASGHADGSIKIWDCDKGTCETTLSGHNGAVTALRYNKLGSLLASGSKDNDIILWDVVAETGLYRLRGHRDQVTDLVFLESGKKLVSSSKDKFLRVWDLDMSHPNEKGKKTPFQHCVQIVSGHHSEIWSVDVDPEEKYLVAGSADRELRFYTVKHESFVRESPFEVNETAKEDADQNKWEVLKPYGEIQRESKDRVATVRFNKSGNILACQVAGKTVDIFRVLDEVESKRKAKRRIHRKKEKKSLKGPEMIENGNADQKSSEDLGSFSVTVLDTFKHIHTLRAKLKICSIAFSPISPKNSLATVVLSMKNNSLEFYSVEKESSKRTVSIELQGHRTAVRSVTLSSDNTLLFSTSLNAVKVWNPSTGSCLRSIESGHGLCGIFGPLNKYALIGTKSGTIEIIDIGSGTRVETVEAHGGDVHSITPIPNQSGFVTGSADHDVKFWEYQVMQKPDHDTKCLTVSNVRTMKMNNDALAIVISPDSKYIAVALLDSTVKVYFMDSLKFFLSLYGHKLPVVCMDISSDGDLIVTGSLDKNLKIWGLDFGDCHKSIFAHADSVMAVKFVHNTHYLFSVGKDRLVKYWDADKFELLLTLEGHHDIVSGLAISNRGDFFITGSYDRSIRCWVRTEEPFFIEEEKEKRLEQMFESDLGNAFENKYAPQEEIPEEGAVALAGKKTQATLTATEAIEDALDLAEEEKARGEMAISQPNILLLGLSPSDYVLRAMSDVHVNDLEQTLLALPFSSALKLMSYLVEWTNNPDKVELVCRIATLLLQIHHNQLITTPAARELLTDLRKIIYDRVEECKDTIGFNLAAMDHLKQLMASKSDAPFRDANAKLQEIRSLLSKRVEERIVIKQERQKKKKQKTEF